MEDKKKINLKIIIPLVIAIVVIIVAVLVVNKKDNNNSNNNNEQQQEQKNENLSKEEKMLQQANTPDWETIFKDTTDNKARATELYDGKIFVSDVFVSSISTDECTVYVKDKQGEYLKRPIRVSLPTKELAKINTGDVIKIVGKYNVSREILLSGYIIEIVKKDNAET